MSAKGKQAKMSLGDFLEDHQTPPHGETGTSSGVEPPDDGGLVFITSDKVADFRSRRAMTTVRKSAMDSYMASHRPPPDSTSTRRQKKERSNLEVDEYIKSTRSLNALYSTKSRSAQESATDSRYEPKYELFERKERIHGKAVALFDFARDDDNELNLFKGQVLLVLYNYGDGWMLAQDLESRETGLVPQEYIQLIDDETAGAQLSPAQKPTRYIPQRNVADHSDVPFLGGIQERDPNSSIPRNNNPSLARQSALYGTSMLTQAYPAVAYASRTPEMSRVDFQTETSPVIYQGNLSEPIKKWMPKPSVGFRRPLPSLAGENPPCNTLHVGNLPMETSEDELKAVFSWQHGYKRFCLRTKQDGPICFVEFEDVSVAENALKLLNGYMLHNSTGGGIELSYAKNPLGVRSGQAQDTPGSFGLPSGATIESTVHQTLPAPASNRSQYVLDDFVEAGMKLKDDDSGANDTLYGAVLGRYIRSNFDYEPAVLVSLNDDAAERVAAIARTLSTRRVRIHHLRLHAQITQREVSLLRTTGDVKDLKTILMDFCTGGLPDNLDTLKHTAELLKSVGSPLVCAFITQGILYKDTVQSMVLSQLDTIIVPKTTGQIDYMPEKFEFVSAREGDVSIDKALKFVYFMDESSPKSVAMERNVAQTAMLGKHNSDIELQKRKLLYPDVITKAQKEWQVELLAGMKAYKGRESTKAEPTDTGDSSVPGNNRSHTPSSPSSVSGFSEGFDIESVSDSGGGIMLPEPTDATSENNLSMANEGDILTQLQDVHIEADFSSNDEEQERRYRQKKKRWSAGVLKRSYSYSDLESSYSEPESQGDEAPKARRLRRRARGPDDQGETLIFQDKEAAENANIRENEKKGKEKIRQRPSSISEHERLFLQDEHTVNDEVERSVPGQCSPAKEQLVIGNETEHLQELVNQAEHAHLVKDFPSLLESNWSDAQMLVPEALRWDLEFQAGVWTCTPLQPDIPKDIPLTIGNAPVVLPVEYHWPPMGGVNPPPDPRPSAPLDTQAPLTVDVIRDIFLTFEGSVGFYLLLSGLLQIIVPDEFDTAWASSHLPHKYGGMKVCYIAQTLEATMLPSTTETSKTRPSLTSPSTGLSSIFRSSRPSTASASPSLKLNDFIEARPKSNHRKEKYAGRLGLKVSNGSDPYLLMSSHIITEAMLAKSHRETIFGRSRDRFEKLDDDWNKSVEIWAGNENIGTVGKTFDTEAEIYPNGFKHDITLIKPTSPAAIRDVTSPIPDLGWLNHMSWASLRQVTSAVKILGPTESHRSAKSIRSSLQSEILIVGEGIFLNQTEAAGNSKSLRDHDASIWRTLVSRALLYRVYPDFEPPKGYSGIALYAEGVREDGTQGPGVVGFQSFVQRSGHVQNYAMEGPALERRLQAGRVAFYGAFECPDELKKNYTIV